ncbi:MAG: aldo/keto reductase [Ruminococcus sp.]|jgi:predicted aldo/keto reductase-like oxidoreductase|nr:aldo/keto reductase [Ruminococcus sp.]
MRYINNPRSGDSLSVLGMGCMRFPTRGAGIDQSAAEGLVKLAYERGVNYFDTAWFYTNSEETLGTAVKNLGIRDKIFIATKLPYLIMRKPTDFDKYIESSLSRLKTDYIDYYLMHMLTAFSDWEKLKTLGALEKIAEWKASGKIRNVGFSFHGSCGEFLKILEDFDWDFCMIQLSYSDPNYQAGVTGLEAAAKRGMPVMIMEPLLGGRLVNGLPEAAETALKNASGRLSGNADWGLNWLWNKPEVAVVLSGMNSESQIIENTDSAAKSAANSFTEAETAAIEEVRRIFGESYKIKCTSCGYCMPCPKNVNIPGCFSAYNTSYSEGFFAGIRAYAMSNAVTSKTPHGAGNCIACRKCEKHCPQNLKISELLPVVKKRLEPAPIALAFRVARAFRK